MASLNVSDRWHIYSQYTYREVNGTLSATVSGTDIAVSFVGSQTSTYQVYGDAYPPDNIFIQVDGVEKCNQDCDMYSDTNINISNTSSYTVGTHVVSLYIRCGDYLECPYDYHNNPCFLGSLSVTIDSPHQQPTLSVSGDTWSKYNTSRSITATYDVNGDTTDHGFDMVVNRKGSATFAGKAFFDYGQNKGHPINNNDDSPLMVSFIPKWWNATSNTYDEVIARDTLYNVRTSIWVTADASYQANVIKQYGIWALPSISISQANLIVPKGTENKITVSNINFANDHSSRINVYVAVTESGTTNNTAVLTNSSTGSNYSGLNRTYTPTTAGGYYRAIATLTHLNSGESNTSANLYGYTYTQPAISNLAVVNVSNSANVTSFSPQDSTNMQWFTNARRWNLENNFETYITIGINTGSSITNVISNTYYSSLSGPTVSATNVANCSATVAPTNIPTTNSTVTTSLTSGTFNVQNIFTTAQRSVNRINMYVNIGRRNPNIPQIVYTAKSVIIQYQPTKQPAFSSLKDQNGSTLTQGSTVSTDTTTSVTVAWTYPSTSGSAGVVSGYDYVVYDNASATGTAVYSGSTSSTSVALNTATRMTSGKINYLKVTPYYTKPDGTGKLSGTQSVIIEMVKPIQRMAKPVISYPVSGTTWHNKDFRILFQQVPDPDYDSYTSAQQTNFSYGNIQVEVKIDGNTAIRYDYRNTYITGRTATVIPNSFSSNLTKYKDTSGNMYKKAIWLGRYSLFSLATSKYEFRIRMQRANYNFTTTQMQDESDNAITWSPWSDWVTLNISAVSTTGYTQGAVIGSAFETGVRGYIRRCYNCYPINTDSSANVSSGDVIKKSDFQNIYKTLSDIISGVNGYCVYDVTAIKFAQQTALPSFTASSVEITNTEDETTGDNYSLKLRNYINNCLR